MKQAIALLALSAAVPAFAQNAAVVAQPAAPAQVAVIQPNTTDNVLRAGNEIPLIIREELTTKKKQLRVGQRIQMEVSANVTQNGVTVIPAGTPAVGEITEVRNKGMWGKSGYIGARVLSLRLGDRHVRLTGTFDDKGVTGTGGVVAAVAFIPVAGFFTTGTSAYIASGSATKGFLDEDIVFRTVAPVQVLEVPAAAPAPVAAGVIPAAVTTKP
ncbi:hypothetical protein [Novosphingobium sp. JCM 18896]|uniref:hypothetical protein n=1 Tax=Novosphingobium sp. JCM 18896 TaxID=2989731 RepID=UPI0022217989|nr:hypothetical protein [Novosphingobium sp. JCM 18896]MCW1431609.1 hypothetical protein [Novosphingobium sp. JCM 18896]